MQVAILSANLGDFDKVVDPIRQNIPMYTSFHRWTDEDFPPITGLTPRLQYRIPKTHGWQMLPGYDIYMWLDGSFSLAKSDSLQWFVDKLGDNDVLLFSHPHRQTVKEEVDHIEDHLQKGKPYITSRYKNGLHKEALAELGDGPLYASTVFMYRNTSVVQAALMTWWYLGSRYFSCDQIVLTHAVRNLKVAVVEENQYKFPYLKEVSKHE